MKTMLVSLATVLLLCAVALSWESDGQIEISQVLINQNNMPTADELRDTRIRLYSTYGHKYDIVFVVDEVAPDATIYIPITSATLTHASLTAKLDTAIRTNVDLNLWWEGAGSLATSARNPGYQQDIRAIGGNGKVTVQAVQQGF